MESTEERLKEGVLKALDGGGIEDGEGTLYLAGFNLAATTGLTIRFNDEAELLAGREHLTLRFRSSVDGEELSVLSAPDGGWTHRLLESAPRPSNGAAWDAFLGSQWIGSSEV